MGQDFDRLPPLSKLMERAGVKAPQLPAAPGGGGAAIGKASALDASPKYSKSAQQVIQNVEAVRKEAFRHLEFYSGNEYARMRNATVAMTYDEYLLAVRGHRNMRRRFEKMAENQEYLKGTEIDEAHFIFRLFDEGRHKPDFTGYINYLSDVSDLYAACVARVSGPSFDKRTREQHTYITGSSGSGKTELIKTLVFNDISAGEAATVIIDPTGNLAGAVARWPEFAGPGGSRLAYIKPGLQPGFLPILNPLDAAHLGPRERGILANQLTGVLAQVVGKGDWTAQTETVASACFQVLVHQPGATLRHLRLALGETDRRSQKLHPVAADLIAAGKRHHIEEVRDFFAYDFQSSQYNTSKGSLRAKLGHILRDELFAKITGGTSTVRIDELVNTRKVVIFDLSAWGDDDAAGAFGRLVVAQLAALGMRRSTHHGARHVPLHVFIDEADLFVSSAVLKILSKLRQHGVHLTLAQQTPGLGFDGADKHQLFNNTAIKFTAGDGQKEMLAMMHAPMDATRGLKQGQFIGRWGRDGETFRLDVRHDLAGMRRSMSAADWQAVVSDQLQRFYRREEEASPLLLNSLPTKPRRRA